MSGFSQAPFCSRVPAEISRGVVATLANTAMNGLARYISARTGPPCNNIASRSNIASCRNMTSRQQHGLPPATHEHVSTQKPSHNGGTLPARESRPLS